MRQKRMPIVALASAAALVFVLQVACSPKPAVVSPTIAPDSVIVWGGGGQEIPMSVEALTSTVDIVVRGVPVSILTERRNLPPDPRSPNATRYMLIERVEFRISEYLKGAGPMGVTVFTGSRESPVGTSSLALQRGQEYVLFLWMQPEGNRFYDGYLIAGEQGKWVVEGSEAMKHPGEIGRLPFDILREKVQSAPAEFRGFDFISPPK